MQTLMTALILSIAFGAPGAFAQSDDLVAVTVEGTSQAATPVDAAREISEKMTAQVAREQAIEIIGDARYAKQKSVVEQKVVREAPKFIPYVSPGEPTRGPDGAWKMSMEMQISRSSLRALIARAGLLVDEGGPASALPMVAMVDRVRGAAYRWWDGEPDAAQKYLAQLARLFHQSLYAEFAKVGLYAIRPQGTTTMLVPEALRVERLSNEGLASLGAFFKAPIVIQGEARIRDSREVAGAFQASFRLTALQAGNGRSVGEVARAFETEVGSFEAVVRAKLTTAFAEVSRDLAAQILDVWQKGALGANVVQLALKGRLGPKQVDAFKAGLLRSVKEIKSARERLFEPGQVVLEIETSSTAAQLAERLRSTQVPGFQTRLASGADKLISLEVGAR